MTTKLITDNFVALVLKDGEILEICDIKKIIDKLLKDEGFPPWHDMELELFDNHDETLIIARRYIIMTSAFCFIDFETMLDAVQSCSPACDASLMSYSGVYYILIGSSFSGDGSIMGEFCSYSHTDENFIAHLKEHGKYLIDTAAIAKLQNNFTKPF